MPRSPQHNRIFAGFSRPNYTIVPDELFDELLPVLSGAELKVLLYIIRRTFGFKREADSISLSQMLTGITTHDGRVLDRGAGLSKPTLLQALRSLQEQGIILAQRRRSVDRGDEPTVYQLCMAGETPGQTFIPPVVKKVDQGGGQEIYPGPWTKNLTTQKTGSQETVKQHTDQSSKTSKRSRKTELEDAAPRDGKRAAVVGGAGATRIRSARGKTQATAGGFTPMQALLIDEGHRYQNTPTVLPEGPTGAVAARQRTNTPCEDGAPARADSERGGQHVSTARRRTRAAAIVAETSAETPQLDVAVESVTSKLGDWRHLRSNLTQARHLLAEFGVSEQELAEILHQAASRTREAAPHKPMAYCFTVARQVLESRPKRKDLVGKYAHLVRS